MGQALWRPRLSQSGVVRATLGRRPATDYQTQAQHEKPFNASPRQASVAEASAHRVRQRSVEKHQPNRAYSPPQPSQRQSKHHCRRNRLYFPAEETNAGSVHSGREPSPTVTLHECDLLIPMSNSGYVTPITGFEELTACGSMVFHFRSERIKAT